MATIDHGADVGVRLPGIYEKLLREQCISECRPDPRVLHAHDDDRPLERADQEAARQADVLFQTRLEAAEAITVPRWRIGGHSFPAPRDVPLFQDRTIRSYRVHADGRVVPVRDRG